MAEPSYHEVLPGGIDIIRWPHKHPLPESEIIAFFEGRKLRPKRWSRSSGEDFAVHTHSYNKILFCVQGGITITLPDLKEQITLNPGDRFVLPSNILHSATVGAEGVSCIEAEA